MTNLLTSIDDAPLLEQAPSLQRALLKTARALRDRGAARLPKVQGVAPLTLARWLHRLAAAEGAAFVHLDARWLQETPEAEESWLARAAAQAGDGTLFLSGEVDPLPRLPGLWVLAEGEGPPVTAPKAVVGHLAWEDTHHAQLTDPTLTNLRRSLMAHCRGASVVRLQGEPGVGRGALARWVHGSLDSRPLSTLRGDGGRVEPGQWLLVEELSSLGATGREQLEEVLRARQPQAPPPPPRGRGRRRPHHAALKPILGKSPALATVLHQAVELAPSKLPVLVLGAPGVGKESLARAVHEMSGRRGAFVPVDVGALPERLAESELFGHVRGAFTGAERERQGAFRAADGGTLFLDELGNLPPALQIKLLRALQEGRVRPLGADREVPVDVRVVAATNADLDSLVRQGRFRADLLGRLNAAPLRLPSLRERPEDVLPLALHFLAEARDAELTDDGGFDDDAQEALRTYPWPGNIRELRNVARYAALTSPGGPVPASALGPLAPENRRPVPLIATTSDEPEDWGVGRASVTALRSTTVHVPPLRDRGPASVRAHVLARLGGRPITHAALELLQSLPWWGNLPRLNADLSALLSATEGPLTVETLKAHLPQLLSQPSQAPIRALLAPVEERSGGVGGLRQDFSDPALLIGRAPSLASLRSMAQGADGARARAWLEELARLGGEVEPGLLSLGILPRLSRAHALVTRSREGLTLHALSGAGLRVEGGPIGQPLRHARPGAPVSLGVAGEARALLSNGTVYLQLFVFLGEVAFAEHAQAALHAARAAEGTRRTQARTQAPTQVGNLGPTRALGTSGRQLVSPRPGRPPVQLGPPPGEPPKPPRPRPPPSP